LYELIQKRPWIFPILLVPIPLVVSIFGITSVWGVKQTLGLVFQPSQVETASTAPWPIILRPAVISGLLVGLFAWLAVALPRSAAFMRRRMGQKRAMTALAVFFTAGTLWLGVVLGDVAWRLALFGPGGLQDAPSLENSPWIYYGAVLGTAALLYLLVRPRARPRK
jgi:hypothetical protein